jgi:hypothetical protein
MCLERITKRIELPTDHELTAWKICGAFQRLLSSRFFGPYMGTLIEVDKWMSASDCGFGYHGKGIICGYNTYYPFGFHCYPTQEMAERARNHLFPAWSLMYRHHYVVVPVRIRYVHTEGADGTDNSDTWKALKITNLVASEIYYNSKDLEGATAP